MAKRVGWTAVATIAALVCGCSSSSAPTSGPSSATCNQGCQDVTTALAVDQTWWLLNNEELAGHPTGKIDVSANCPAGGTAQISGTDGVSSNNIETFQLTITMASCANAEPGYSMTFSGMLAVQGTFCTDGSCANAITLTASSFTISGTAKVDDDPQVQETCAVSLTDTSNGSSSSDASLNGLICGRQFSG